MRIQAAPLWALAFLCVNAVPACKRRPPAPTDGAAGAAGAGTAASPELQAQVLARVGDRTITLGEYAAALEHMDQFDRLRYRTPERRRALLGEMIDTMLLADEAREKGYDRDPETQEEIRQILRDAVLRKARETLPAPNDIEESEVRAYFEAHRGDFRDPERRRVSAVVLPSEASAAAALETLRKDPQAWAALVRTESLDSQAKETTAPDLAGDLGFVGPPGDPRGQNARVPEEVRAAVFELAHVGDISPRAVNADHKAYVLKLQAKTDSHDRTLPEVERTIRVKLAQEKAHAGEAALLETLRKQIPVQIDETALAQVKVEMSAKDAGRD
jgi:hypothetical protein